jgi:hypothetical protein
MGTRQTNSRTIAVLGVVATAVLTAFLVPADREHEHVS